MKKLIFLLIVVLGISCGCKKQENVELITTEQKSEESNKELGDNLFLPKANLSSLKFNGTFFSETDEGYKKEEVTVNFCEIVQLEKGILYKLEIEKSDILEEERLTLGYFYVQKNKIFKSNLSEEKLREIKEEDILAKSYIVCQDTEIKDQLATDEKGEHYYLLAKGDEREHHYYCNQVETGYYETIIWKENEGLVFYESGYGAERDLIRLEVK